MSRPGGPARQYTWTGDGLLAAMGDGGETGFSTTYEYDHAGERWRRTEDGLGTWYLDDLVELSDARGAVEYLPFPGGRCAVDETGQARCTLKDQMNAVMMADAGGRVLSKNSFYPYGQRISLVSAASGPRPVDAFSPFGFNDKRKERRGDLIYYGARYYDPFTRQFISVDPLREAGADDTLGGNSLQPYVYAGANPTSYVDSAGEMVTHLVCRGKCRPEDMVRAQLAISTLGAGGYVSLPARGLTTGLTRAVKLATDYWRALPLAAKLAIEYQLTKTFKSLVMEAKGDDVDEEEDARRQRKWDRDNLNNERKKRDGKKRRTRKVKTGAAAVDQQDELNRAKKRDDRLIDGDQKGEQNVDTQLGHLRTLEDSKSWEEE